MNKQLMVLLNIKKIFNINKRKKVLHFCALLFSFTILALGFWVPYADTSQDLIQADQNFILSKDTIGDLTTKIQIPFDTNATETAAFISVSYAIEDTSVVSISETSTADLYLAKDATTKFKSKEIPIISQQYIPMLNKKCVVATFRFDGAEVASDESIIIKPSFRAENIGQTKICIYMPASEDIHKGEINSIDSIEDRTNLVKRILIDEVARTDTETVDLVEKTKWFPISKSLDINNSNYPDGCTFVPGTWEKSSVVSGSYSIVNVIVNNEISMQDENSQAGSSLDSQNQVLSNTEQFSGQESNPNSNIQDAENVGTQAINDVPMNTSLVSLENVPVLTVGIDKQFLTIGEEGKPVLPDSISKASFNLNISSDATTTCRFLIKGIERTKDLSDNLLLEGNYTNTAMPIENYFGFTVNNKIFGSGEPIKLINNPPADNVVIPVDIRFTPDYSFKPGLYEGLIVIEIFQE